MCSEKTPMTFPTISPPSKPCLRIKCLACRLGIGRRLTPTRLPTIGLSSEMERRFVSIFFKRDSNFVLAKECEFRITDNVTLVNLGFDAWFGNG